MKWFIYLEKSSHQRLWLGYAVAVGGTAVAALARWALGMWVDNLPPFITFYPAVLAAAVTGGAGAGVLAAILGALAADFLFIPPIGTLWPLTPGHLAGLVLFGGINAAISVVGGRLRATYLQSRLQTAALESAVNAIAITDRQGFIQWVNPAFETLTGYTSTEAQGRTLRLLNSGTHDRAFFKQMWETIQAGSPWHGELVNKRKDGTLYHEEMTITPLKSPRGAVTHFITVKQDITGRKQAQPGPPQGKAVLRYRHQQPARHLLSR